MAAPAGSARIGVVLALSVFACAARGTTKPHDEDGGASADPIASLQPYEDALRRGFDFVHPPSAETGAGADPWAIRRVDGGWVGVLRGRSAVVLLDDALHERARVPAPRSTSGLAVGPDGGIVVVGELSNVVARYAVRDGALVARGETPIAGALGLRDVAVAPDGVVWALDEHGGRLFRMTNDGAVHVVAIGHGATALVATSRHVVVNAVADHDLVVVDTHRAAREPPPVRIHADGPHWGFDARETDRGLVVVAGGVEDHPLERRDGYFGFIDSFVYAYRVVDGVAQRSATVNVAERGVVTPKAIAIEAISDARVDLLITGYGGRDALRMGLDANGSVVEETRLALVPGIRSLAGLRAMASPLLDAWIRYDASGVTVVPVPDDAKREPASRLGEALFFTTLMAPQSTSEGAHSRFTCETCHFEGYVDGRVHHTGRDAIRATTKPLVGLVGNRPHFSRALDPDLATVSHAEFRVAGAGTPADPFFDLDPRAYPWLAYLGVETRVTALDLRRALLRFLVDFSHRPSPAVVGRSAFTPLEREGARVFERRCERCHAARLSADDPASRVDFERWEALTMSEAGPIVWGSAGYQTTGVLPYVHPSGARTPSLRRLAKKFPYFTNGSARSLDDVLDRVRGAGDVFLHAGGTSDEGMLAPSEKRALRAFLALL